MVGVGLIILFYFLFLGMGRKGGMHSDWVSFVFFFPGVIWLMVIRWVDGRWAWEGKGVIPRAFFFLTF